MDQESKNQILRPDEHEVNESNDERETLGIDDELLNELVDLQQSVSDRTERLIAAGQVKSADFNLAMTI